MCNKLDFIIVGLKPVDRLRNDFLAKLDLGIDGVYVNHAETATLTISGDIKPDDHYKAILKTAYEQTGFKDVRVYRIHENS